MVDALQGGCGVRQQDEEDDAGRNQCLRAEAQAEPEDEDGCQRGTGQAVGQREERPGRALEHRPPGERDAAEDAEHRTRRRDPPWPRRTCSVTSIQNFASPSWVMNALATSCGAEMSRGSMSSRWLTTYQPPRNSTPTTMRIAHVVRVARRRAWLRSARMSRSTASAVWPAACGEGACRRARWRESPRSCSSRRWCSRWSCQDRVLRRAFLRVPSSGEGRLGDELDVGGRRGVRSSRDDEALAGDVCRRVRAEERGDLGNVLGVPTRPSAT